MATESGIRPGLSAISFALAREAGNLPLEGRDLLRKGFGKLAHVYNPLTYGWPVHEAFLARYGAKAPREILLVGMNPGPWGMGQTGVPFGDPAMVRDWMGLAGHVTSPPNLHPSRPVIGLASTRREGSGTTIYGWAQDRFVTADAFFDRFFVTNYCPLLFFDEGGKNATPADFRKGPEIQALKAMCDRALGQIIATLKPKYVIGVGAFAAERARQVAGVDAVVGSIIHPSSQNQGRWAGSSWGALVDRDLGALCLKLPTGSFSLK